MVANYFLSLVFDGLGVNLQHSSSGSWFCSANPGKVYVLLEFCGDINILLDFLSFLSCVCDSWLVIDDCY